MWVEMNSRLMGFYHSKWMICKLIQQGDVTVCRSAMCSRNSASCFTLMATSLIVKSWSYFLNLKDHIRTCKITRRAMLWVDPMQRGCLLCWHEFTREFKCCHAAQAHVRVTITHVRPRYLHSHLYLCHSSQRITFPSSKLALFALIRPFSGKRTDKQMPSLPWISLSVAPQPRKPSTLFICNSL